MLDAVTDGLSEVIGWVGTVIESIVTAPGADGAGGGALYPLLGLFGVGIAISAVLLSIRVIKSVVWGA